jgi:hypothetical protein
MISFRNERSLNQKEMIMKRSNIAQTLAIAAIVVVASGMASTAKAADKGCTNASLRGTYSHMATGFETAPPAIAGPLAGVGTDTFDGNGGVTTTATLSINGNIVPLTATGTYKVNPDCTGTYKISSPGGTTTLFFVIDDNGNEIRAVCIDPGVVLTHIFRLQFAVGDWRN